MWPFLIKTVTSMTGKFLFSNAHKLISVQIVTLLGKGIPSMKKLGSQRLMYIALGALLLVSIVTLIQLINEHLLVDQYEMAEPFSSGSLITYSSLEESRGN